MRFEFNRHRKQVTLTWTLPLSDMEEVGYALQRAGLGPKGEIRDRGFYDDGTEILEAVWAFTDDEESDSPGLRISVSDA
jgi:hypothetical protein